MIRNAVWPYFRFALSLRDVEEMLTERGIDASYEAIRGLGELVTFYVGFDTYDVYVSKRFTANVVPGFQIRWRSFPPNAPLATGRGARSAGAPREAQAFSTKRRTARATRRSFVWAGLG